MATNEQILERLETFEKNYEKRMEDYEASCKRNDDAIRGNGGTGLKAQVASNTKMLNEIKWYFRGVLMILAAEFLARIVGLI